MVIYGHWHYHANILQPTQREHTSSSSKLEAITKQRVRSYDPDTEGAAPLIRERMATDICWVGKVTFKNKKDRKNNTAICNNSSHLLVPVMSQAHSMFYC